MLVVDNGIFNLRLFGYWNLSIVQFCGLEKVCFIGPKFLGTFVSFTCKWTLI